MKPRAAVIALLLFFCPSVCGATVTNFSQKTRVPEIKLEPPPKTFSVGEHIEMTVSWFGIPVGIGTLDVKELVSKNGRKAFHVIAIARSNDFLSKLYPVWDEVHSYIDSERFCSLEYSRNVQEGRYRAHERIVYDLAVRKGYRESLKNGTTSVFDLPARDVHDIISAFYWFRLQAIEPGKSLHLTVNDEEKNWDLEVRVLKKERKEFRGGIVLDTLQVEPKTRLKGILVERGRAWVWFTADNRRLPVAVKIETPYGPVTASLKDFKSF